MEFINFLVSDIFKKPPLFLGIVALIGLLIQKKPVGEVIKGTIKTIIGVIILTEGVNIVIKSVDPLSRAFNSIFSIEGSDSLGSIITMNEFINNYGSYIGLIIILAFIINLVVAKFTPFKNIYLTGHIFFWMSFICVASGVRAGLEGFKLVLFSTFFLSLYIIITPAIIRPFVNLVTGDNSFTIGHTTIGLSLIGALIGKVFGNKEKSIEDLKVPRSLDFIRDTTIMTSLVMTLVYIITSLSLGYNRRIIAFGIENSRLSSSIVFSIIQGITFGAGLTILLMGVRLMISEIVASFKGISDKVIEDSIPALDVPVIFPYSPNALIVGFILSTISSLVTIFVIGYFNLTTIAVIPLTVACFFDAGPAAIFGNATGGRRGAVLASIVSGILLIVLNVMAIEVIGNIVPDFLRAFGGNDFSIWTIIMRLFT